MSIPAHRSTAAARIQSETGIRVEALDANNYGAYIVDHGPVVDSAAEARRLARVADDRERVGLGHRPRWTARQKGE